jgi:general secretion pathway protein L
MAETLVIRLTAAHDGTAEWLVVDGSGARISDPAAGDLATAAKLTENRRVVALVPPTQVLRLSADVPLKSASKIRQALPFALEEQLAGDIEAQHFACQKRDAAGRIPVAVVTTQLMDHWAELFAANGLKPNAVYSEIDGVANLPATIVVLIDDDHVIIRDQQGESTVVDPGSLSVALELLLDQQAAEFDKEDDEEDDEDHSILPVNLLIYCKQNVHDSNEELWDRLRMRTESLELKILAEGALPRLADEIQNSGGVNLLQGAYARKTEFGLHWKEWQLAASLLGACVVLILGFQGISYWQLSSQENDLDMAAEAVLRATFSDVGEVQDPWNELRSRLGAGTTAEAVITGPGFAAAVEALSIAFVETPGIRLQTLSYRGGVVDLQLVAPNVAALDQLRQLITGPGKFSADIQSANPKNDVIEGRMQITANQQ